jgi:hypothetical protein
MNLKYPENTDVNFTMIFGRQLPFARNHIVNEAIKNNSDYLFWIDADMTFQADSLIRLLDRNVDICHALSFRRIKPYYPCLFKWNEKENSYETIDYSKSETDLISVDAAGSACTLIKMDVYKKLKYPYYYYRDNLISSDLTFSENVKKAGHSIYVDRTLKTGHIGDELVVSEEFYLATMSEDAKKEWNENM